MNVQPGLVRLEACVSGFLFVVIADEGAVVRSVLRPGREELRRLRGVPEGTSRAILSAGKFIDCYLRGGEAEPPPLNLEGFTGAECAVYRACMKIPCGDRMSYGELALSAGFPRAARFAGSCMRKNRHMLFVPCHRVVPASGGIGLYSGGEDIKRSLLEFESRFFM